MKQFAKSYKVKGTRGTENALAPISISGFIVPWEESSGDNSQSHFKLTCNNGTEYLIVDNSEVRDLLPLYCWKEVKIVGLLNKSNMTLIPQKVFPKGPDGESSNVLDMSLWKTPKLKREVFNRINEFVIMPAAVLAVLAS